MIRPSRHALAFFLALCTVPAFCHGQFGFSSASYGMEARDVYEFAVEDGRLVMDLKIAPEGRGGFTIRGVAGGMARATNRSSVFKLTLNYQDARQNGVQLTLQRPPFQIDIQQTIQSKPPVAMRLIQFDNQENGSDGIVVRLLLKVGSGELVGYTAPDFETLCRDHPREAMLYIAPAFRALGVPALIKVAPSLALQVFSEPATAAAVERELPKLVKQLDADAPADRAASAERILALGPKAQAALRKLDLTSLSPQQQTAVEALLDSPDVLPSEDIDRFRKDVDFLLDCLYLRDEFIRRAASEHLVIATRRPLVLAIPADAAQRADAIEALRRELAPLPE